MYNSSHILITVNIIFQSVALWFCHKGRMTDLYWVQGLIFLRHLGVIDGPVVPHNLISNTGEPCPLRKVTDGPQI